MFRLKPKSSLHDGSEPVHCPGPGTQAFVCLSPHPEGSLGISGGGGDKSFSLEHPPTERWLKTEGKEGPEGRRTSKGMTESVPREVGMLENQMVPRWVRK